jgi:BlaI family transcriptional regulator, penicillinase repressor
MITFIDMETLTAYEEELMQIIWTKKKVLVKDVLNELKDPKPPYTTLASHIKMLEKKGYLGNKSYGKTLEYFPIVQQNTYQKTSFQRILGSFYQGSVANFLSFLVKEEKLSETDLLELKELIEKNKKE